MSESSSFSFKLLPEKVASQLFKVMIVIVLLHLVTFIVAYAMGREDIFGLVRIFNLDTERTVPAAFSVLILLIASALLGLVWHVSRRKAIKNSWYWMLLAVGFLVMGIDEAWSYHETLSGPIKNMIGVENDTAGVLFYAWVIPAIILVAILGLVFIKFLIGLPKRTRNGFIIAGAIYVSGAVGMELVGGLIRVEYGIHGLAYFASVTIEETLEMVGVILFIREILTYLETITPKIEISLS